VHDTTSTDVFNSLGNDTSVKVLPKSIVLQGGMPHQHGMRMVNGVVGGTCAETMIYFDKFQEPLLCTTSDPNTQVIEFYGHP